MKEKANSSFNPYEVKTSSFLYLQIDQLAIINIFIIKFKHSISSNFAKHNMFECEYFFG
jgi:hypothetical protein